MTATMETSLQLTHTNLQRDVHTRVRLCCKPRFRATVYLCSRPYQTIIRNPSLLDTRSALRSASDDGVCHRSLKKKADPAKMW